MSGSLFIILTYMFLKQLFCYENIYFDYNNRRNKPFNLLLLEFLSSCLYELFPVLVLHRAITQEVLGGDLWKEYINEIKQSFYQFMGFCTGNLKDKTASF